MATHAPAPKNPRGGSRLLGWGVLAAFAVMTLSNVLASATTVFNGTDNARISRENPTYLTPDGLTFSIWGFIYLFEACFVVYQLLPRTRDAIPCGARLWAVAAFLLNALWLPVFAYHRWFLSLGVIIAYLYSLHRTSEALRVDYASSAKSWHTKLFAWVGFSLNYAWVVVATLLNFTIVSRNSSIITTSVTQGVTKDTAGVVAAQAGGSPLTAVIGGDVDWAIFCIVVASILACVRSVRKCDVVYALVTSWALGGIYRMQKFSSDRDFPAAGRSNDLATWAITFVGIAAVGAVVGVVYAIFRRFTRTRSASGDVDSQDAAVGAVDSLSQRLSSGGPVTGYGV